MVAHDQGPALVIAVAGSGKSTCLVQRIERLVRENVFPPGQILASSFNKLAIEDLRLKLRKWPHCDSVNLKTLHSLGYMILREARREEGIPLPQNDGIDPEKAGSKILFEAIRQARQENAGYTSQLDFMDQDDFLDYIGQCKGNIEYPDLSTVILPPVGRQLASQAKSPDGLPWYLDLYRLYERIRRENNWITFDDMLLEGWESLVRSPDLLARFQQRYSCVLVDEFQDINQVQDAILDHLTSDHRNYMAIGDDDQTIYEWRGADPGYILNFEKRYRAKTYHLSWNFRSTSTQILLANEVIRHNRKRARKHLRLSRKVPGETRLIRCLDTRGMADAISRVFQERFAQGLTGQDAVILVRLYAQTPPLERALIERKIAYRIEGNVPFYQRKEVTLFLEYLRVGLWERTLREGTAFSRSIAQNAWNTIYYQPKRYIGKELSGEIFSASVRNHLPLSQSLLNHASMSGYTQDMILGFSRDIAWLGKEIQKKPASTVLRELDQRMKITDHLIRGYATQELKREMKFGILNFFDYTEGLGSARELLEHIDWLIASHQAQSDDQAYVTIMTIHRAKGKEWELVLVPQVNQGMIPYTGNDNLEEERRLFYVAITRAKESLELYFLQSQELSSFLREADTQKLLNDFHKTEGLLTCDSKKLEIKDLFFLLRSSKVPLFREYLPVWWDNLSIDLSPLAGRLTQLAAVLNTLPSGRMTSIPGTTYRLWKELTPNRESSSTPSIQDFPGLEEWLTSLGQKVEVNTDSLVNWQVGQAVMHRAFGKGKVVRFAHKSSDQPCVEVYFRPPHGLKLFSYPPEPGFFQ